MGKMSCFAGLLGGGRRKALKGKNKGAYAKKVNGNDCPKVKPVEFMDMPDATVDVSGCEDSAPASCNSKVVVRAATELARDGSGEDGDKAAIKRACSSGADLAVAGAGAGESVYSSDGTEESAKSTEPGPGEESPAAGRTSPAPTPAASPKLKRSCSNIETTRSSAPPRGFDFDLDLPAKSRSYNDLNAAPPARSAATPSGAGDASPAAASFRSSCSADRVMLKKRSSRQVLPSRSRKLWWRLFLWSHSNLHHAGGHARHAAATVGRAPPARRVHVRHAGRGHRGRREGKGAAVEEGPIPNQWVAFSAGASPLDRVSAWVNSLGDGSFYHAVDEEEDDVSGHDGAAAAAVRPQCSDDEIVEVPAAGKRRPARAKRRTAADEAVNEARSVVHTLNAFSSAAHIAGMGLKAVPAIAGFSTLRAVNLSGNLIVQISAGSLPKGLRSLDLSRNRIAAVEGLREMTRLRVLNLSYNRISRIGHGLSSCTAIKELYLAGNKISDVEGLHRLLKLAVLDLSFNKITTAKSMGQLVANYGSLRALNLVGNPVQVATGDDALRRAVSGLLPRIEYLNKQAVRPQRAREAAKDSVAQAALGIGGAGDGWSSRRRAARRVTKSPGGSSGKGRGRDGSGSRRGGGGGSRSRSKTRAQAAGAGPSVSRR